MERKKIADLIPNPENARIHTREQIDSLAQSIEEWGWTMPILIDEHGAILAGHGRVEAAQLLGITDVPCVVATGWTAEQKAAYALADNKIGDMSSFDLDLLAQQLDEIGEISLEAMGFDDSEVYDAEQTAEVMRVADFVDSIIEPAPDEEKTPPEKRTCPHCGGEL